MATIQSLFINLADVLLAVRYSRVLPTAPPYRTAFGVTLRCEGSPANRQLLTSNWRRDSNEMIVQFFLESQGMSFLVEEWSIFQEGKSTPKQLSLLLRSALVMMTMTQLHQLHGAYALSHSFQFYNRQSKKRSDWVNDSTVEVSKLVTKSRNSSISLTVAQQGSLDAVMQRISEEQPIIRHRFHSEHILEPKSARQRKMTLDTHCSEVALTKRSSSSNQMSYVSVFSKKEDVEILSTSNKIEELSWTSDEYEFQMLVEDKDDFLLSALMTNIRLSKEDRDYNINLVDQMKSLQTQSKKSRRASIQIPMLINYIDNYYL